MDAITKPQRLRWYYAQIVLVGLLISLVTFATVKLAMLPSPWHSSWMIVLPLVLGIALNKGAARWFMALALVVVSLVATTVTGNAMGY
jgi:hypothetical protein